MTTNFNFGGMDMVPLLGAIAGCHCSVLWWGEGRVTTNFGGVDVVPLQGAIVVSYGGRREGFGGVDVVPLQGAIVVSYGGGREGFGGVDVVPFLGAIAGCQFLFHIFLLYSGPPISRRRPRKQQ